MIKIENTVFPSAEQMKFVIEGMRNPMNSWDKSDTYFERCTYMKDKPCDTNCSNPQCHGPYISKEIGKNDLALMKKLADAGTDHRKFMRMMPVMARITAPLYWWKEFDTYKVGTVANSCSTMHKIADKPFDISDFSVEHLISNGAADRGHDEPAWQLSYDSIGLMQTIINNLNYYRESYLKRQDKLYWQNMIQMLPSCYNQTRNVYMNYEVLSKIYFARKNHKLNEWQEFCNWIDGIPYIDILLA